ncbi:MAG: ubiquinone biosynthesis accessory factor UbiJ [Nevskia sp.]|uniref:ubiquinone biosynthesis accessory factor UbiJ n=1 Tax=Nevskia sp. TaxID=1929292 RepID=UPI00403637E6
MAAPALVCATVEVALNRYLRLERSVVADCAAMAGKSIALEAADLGWMFVIEPIATGVRVSNVAEEEPDVLVSAPTLRLARLGLNQLTRREGLPTGVDVVGDIELLNRFGGLLSRVGFDPEELVAKVVGDGAAHRLVGGLKGLFGFGRSAADRLSRDTAEYLTEESEDLARAADVEEWMDAVDGLREGVDRLEARLARLEQRSAP